MPPARRLAQGPTVVLATVVTVAMASPALVFEVSFHLVFFFFFCGSYFFSCAHHMFLIIIFPVNGDLTRFSLPKQNKSM